MKRQIFIAAGVLLIIALISLVVIARPHKVWTLSNETLIEKPTAVVFDYVTTAA